MSSFFLWVFNCLFLMALVLPAVQYTFSPFERKRLMNTTIDRKLPDLRLATVLDRSFQQRLDTWFLQNNGLWGQLVTTNNEINFRFFEQLQSKYGSGQGFMIGNKHAIFQAMYLRDFNGDLQIDTKEARRTVRQLKLLQDQLKERGKAFIVLVSANKLALHPEYVPERYKRRPRGKRMIEQLKPIFDKFGINYFDTRAFLESKKSEYEHPFFALPAAHWNSVAACLVSKRLFELADKQLETKLHKLRCGPEYEVLQNPVGDDRDLLRVLNVWDPTLSYEETPYMSSSRIDVAEASNPKVLYVGTSFIWSILKMLENPKLYGERDFFYYGKTNHAMRTNPSGEAIKVRKSLNYDVINWEDEILSKDIVVIEVNEARLYDLGFIFLQKAARAIKKLEKVSSKSKSASR